MAPNPNGIRIIQVDDGCSVMYFRPHPITAADIDQIVSRYPREAGVGPSVRGDPKRGATVMERWLR